MRKTKKKTKRKTQGRGRRPTRFRIRVILSPSRPSFSAGRARGSLGQVLALIAREPYFFYVAHIGFSGLPSARWDMSHLFESAVLFPNHLPVLCRGPRRRQAAFSELCASSSVLRSQRPSLIHLPFRANFAPPPLSLLQSR